MYINVHDLFLILETPMLTARLNEIVALGIMFVAGYACMIVV